jgi:hypothetical protein
MKVKPIYIIALVVLSIGTWLAESFIFGYPPGPARLIAPAITCALVFAGLVLAARQLSPRVWMWAGLLILAGLLLPTAWLVQLQTNLSRRLPEIFVTLLGLVISAIPLLALVVSALLLHAGLASYQEVSSARIKGPSESGHPPTLGPRVADLAVILSALLIVKVLYNLYWLTVWDNTGDSLGYLWLIIPVLTVFYAALVLAITLPGRVKLAGLLYALVVPALMIGVSYRAQQVDFRRLTEERAGRVSRAIEAFYDREGYYPQTLNQLTPWTLLSIPTPVIMSGQDWCYRSGVDFYQLGYVYREHWFSPKLISKLYKAVGNPPDQQPVCNAEITTLQNRYPNFYGMGGN